MSTIGRNTLCPCGSGSKYKACCYNQLRKIVICTPMRDEATAEYTQALNRDRKRFDIVHLTEVGRPIVDARNALATRALSAASADEYILWIDDDAWWQPGTVARMLRIMQERQDVDMLAASFAVRAPFARITAFTSFFDDSTMLQGRQSGPGCGLVRIEAVGMHFVLYRRNLLERVGTDPFSVPLGSNMSEDFAFCRRVLDCGATIGVHTGIFVAHCDGRGEAFYPATGPGRIIGDRFVLSNDTRPISEIVAEYAPRVLAGRTYGTNVNVIPTVVGTAEQLKELLVPQRF